MHWRVKTGWRGVDGGLGMGMEGVDLERWTLERRMQERYDEDAREQNRKTRKGKACADGNT